MSIAWSAATVAFVLVATLVPWAQDALRTVSLSGREWGLVIGVALIGTFWVEEVACLAEQSLKPAQHALTR